MTVFTSWLNLGSQLSPTRDAYWNSFDRARNRIVVYGGGANGGGALAYHGIVEWNPVSCVWTNVATSSLPTAVFGADRMAYDRVRREHVLFGGLNAAGNVLYDETWVYDGSTPAWTHKSPGTVPDARWSYAMEYDPVRDVTVMFGGWLDDAQNTCASDTCIWDGTNWTITTPSPSPLADAEIFMGWDSVNEQLVLYTSGKFVGSGGAGEGETWVWDGAWAQKSPATSIPTKDFAPMCGVEGQGVYMAATLNSPFARSDQTWFWDGTDWNDITPASPGDRLPYAHGIAYGIVEGPCTQVFALMPTGVNPSDPANTYAWTACPCAASLGIHIPPTFVA